MTAPEIRAARDNAAALRQGLRLLPQLGAERYRTRIASCFGASAGGHVRHIVEHYDSLLAGLALGRVDYESRPRDLRVEEELAYATRRMEAVVTSLEAFDRLPGGAQSVRIRAETTTAAEGEAWAESCLLRELEYLLSHTVHHYALIAIMSRMLGVEPEPDFGIAPSTLRHRQRSEVLCAR